MLKERLCVACRRKEEADTLWRFTVKSHSLPLSVQLEHGSVLADNKALRAFALSSVVWDFSQTLPGRGAYVCNAPACWQKLSAKRLLQHALKQAVTEEDYLLLSNFETAEMMAAAFYREMEAAGMGRQRGMPRNVGDGMNDLRSVESRHEQEFASGALTEVRQTATSESREGHTESRIEADSQLAKVSEQNRERTPASHDLYAERLARMLGLARRANKLESGYMAVAKALKRRKALVLFLAQDMAADSVKEADNLLKASYEPLTSDEAVEATRTPETIVSTEHGKRAQRRAQRPAVKPNILSLCRAFTKEELSSCLDKSYRAFLAICDPGFAVAVRKILAEYKQAVGTDAAEVLELIAKDEGVELDNFAAAALDDNSELKRHKIRHGADSGASANFKFKHGGGKRHNSGTAKREDGKRKAGKSDGAKDAKRESGKRKSGKSGNKVRRADGINGDKSHKRNFKGGKQTRVKSVKAE